MSSTIAPEVERRNGLIYLISVTLTYFAAPVTYVGIVQAALCDKLGASATVSNLPDSAYLIGSAAPLLLSWGIPPALERPVLVWAHVLMAILLALVGITLVFPLDNSIRIAAVIGHGLIMGLLGSVAQVYMMQCLGRGTTLEGMTRTFKVTYAIGPVAAVAGSLGAQAMLGQHIAALRYPYDFAWLYFAGVPCMAAVALLSGRYTMEPIAAEPPPPLVQYVIRSLKVFFQVRALALAGVAYVFFFLSLEGMSNLSLYTKEALGRDPKDFSGLIMALRFGFKCIAGYVLGVIAHRWGIRAPVIGTLLPLVGAMLWAWVIPGYSFLFTFALLGAAELGGLYFPGYVLAISPAEAGARNMSILSLATFIVGFAPALHGALTDKFGFPASFLFGGLAALVALYLTLRLPSKVETRGI